MLSIKRLLKNYLDDLEYAYHYSGGFEGVNHMSCGTPEFISDAEYKEYITMLKAKIAEQAE